MGIPNHEWESGSGFRDFQEGFLFQATCVDNFKNLPLIMNVSRHYLSICGFKRNDQDFIYRYAVSYVHLATSRFMTKHLIFMCNFHKLSSCATFAL